MNCNVTAIWRAHKRGAFFGNPCFTQIHPTCLPLHGESQSKLTLMSESLRNDGRVWVSSKKQDMRNPGDIPEDERDYYLERKYPSFGILHLETFHRVQQRKFAMKGEVPGVETQFILILKMRLTDLDKK
jgi:succinate dehydrogenase/fumarate reductase flavoprotein subunit